MTILGLLPIIDDFAVRSEPLAQKTSGFVEFVFSNRE
jgi:hypothetical protein